MWGVLLSKAARAPDQCLWDYSERLVEIVRGLGMRGFIRFIHETTNSQYLDPIWRWNLFLSFFNFGCSKKQGENQVKRQPWDHRNALLSYVFDETTYKEYFLPPHFEFERGAIQQIF